MTNKLSKKILLIIGLSTVIFEADAAATATATVTANIVPISSFSISESFQQRITHEENSDAQQALINNNRIAISSLNNKNAVKVEIISYHNDIYDLSISSNSILCSPDSSTRMKIDHMKIHNNTPSLNSNNGQALIIEGLLTKPDSNYTGPYSGTTEITVNYN